MHELSIAQNIMEIVLKHVPEDAQVRAIRVAVGRLSGVVPESLEFCFGSVVHDTPLDGSQLEIERIPVKAQCSACHETFTKDDDTIYICPTCNSTDLEFITGTELKVVEVAIAEDEAPSKMSIIKIERRVLEKNDELAGQNRELLSQHDIFALNMVSSPGAGKTSILERTLEILKDDLEIAVIEGDVQTDYDAQRVARYEVPVAQIVTHGGCHLEARLVRDALSEMDLSKVELLIIENVGNLVCPANYDLGEAEKVVLLSTTEGDDKPKKYPAMFRNASVLIINKMDLIPYVNCDPAVIKTNALQINPHLKIFETSCTTKVGIEEWCDWLKGRARMKRG